MLPVSHDFPSYFSITLSYILSVLHILHYDNYNITLSRVQSSCVLFIVFLSANSSKARASRDHFFCS